MKGRTGQQVKTLVEIGIGADGSPLYAYRDTAPAPVQPAPLVQRPWAAYAGAGCFALAALLIVAFVAVVLVLGLALGLVVLAVAVTALTICLLVLRSMWRDLRTDKR